MAEENYTRTMNLDLNLGPLDDSSDVGELGSGAYPSVAVNLDDWLDRPPFPRLREVVRHRNQRWRSQLPIPPETQNIALELLRANALHADDQGSERHRHAEMPKMCDKGSGCTEEHEDPAGGKKDDVRKIHSEDGSLFDCNICLDLAKDPVVTCCGHLFCWPCLYQWLYRHSDDNECPVCRGVVTITNVTPIYGRGSTNQEANVDCGLQIPHRPQAQVVERERLVIQRTDLTTPMEEMIRRLGSTYDLSRGLTQLQAQSQEIPERRSMHRDWSPAAVLSDEDLFNLSETSTSPNYEMRGYQWFSSMLLHGTNSLRMTTLTSLASALNTEENPAAERLVQSYFQSNPVAERSLPPPFEDGIHASENHHRLQDIYNAFEIEPPASASASRGRNGRGSWRILNVDDADVFVPRRRRRLS